MGIEHYIIPDLSSPEWLEQYLNNIKHNVADILKWKNPETQNQDSKNEWLDEFSDMFKKIDRLKNTTLSSKDQEFLILIWRYYDIVANKPELKPIDYKNYLRIVRDELWVFYLSCVLDNTYDITKNPLNISLSDILKVCTFVGKKFKDKDGKIDWETYFNTYGMGGNLKLIELLEDAKEKIPHFKKWYVNIPLLLKIFDLSDELSKDVFDYMLLNHLWYTKAEIVAIHKNYTW